MKAESTVLWQRLDEPGHEIARLTREDSSWRLAGTAVLVHEQLPCRLEYEIVAAPAWTTTSAKVQGFVGDREIDVTVEALHGTWQLNSVPVSVVDGCLDVDLNFSPSTNLLPIRRMNLEIGESARVRAAWLRFPSFTLEPLEQTYTRMALRTWRYESAGGRFVAEIEVNDPGLPVRYAGFWAAVAML